jgi:uncharacterized protein DUF2783
MATLVTESRISDPDAFYAELIDLHRDLTEEQSRKLNAKLILILANHIGEIAILRQAMTMAREDLG